MEIKKLFSLVTETRASDIHLKSGKVPYLRIGNNVLPSSIAKVFQSDDIEKIIDKLMDKAGIKKELQDKFKSKKEFIFSCSLKDIKKEIGGFRVSTFYEKGNKSAVIRVIPGEIPSLSQLGYSSYTERVLKSITSKTQGLILCVGATGSGKTTTLASMINCINLSRGCHIITIEDPIDFFYKDKRSIISQRELGRDTESFPTAIKYALTQDPDIILIGEMRDEETISTVLRASQTGHLIFSTLHSNDGVQAIERIISSVKPDYQEQSRFQLSLCLECVIFQKLLKRVGGVSRVPALEIVLNNEIIARLIRERRTSEIYEVIEKDERPGVFSLNQSLKRLIESNIVDPQDALAITTRSDDLKSKIRGVFLG